MITYNSIPFNIENKIVESYRDGQSMQTIADTLNISIGTVNKYVHKNMTEVKKQGYRYRRQIPLYHIRDQESSLRSPNWGASTRGCRPRGGGAARLGSSV